MTRNEAIAANVAKRIAANQARRLAEQNAQPSRAPQIASPKPAKKI
jgi:hypothetical protein